MTTSSVDEVVSQLIGSTVDEVERLLVIQTQDH